MEPSIAFDVAVLNKPIYARTKRSQFFKLSGNTFLNDDEISIWSTNLPRTAGFLRDREYLVLTGLRSTVNVVNNVFSFASKNGRKSLHIMRTS